jgi:hypothetical protein
MEKAQYRVLERITSKGGLQIVLARPSMKSKARKEALLKDQLLVRYTGFESVPKRS